MDVYYDRYNCINNKTSTIKCILCTMKTASLNIMKDVISLDKIGHEVSS